MSTQQLASRPKFSAAIQSDGYKRLINQTLTDPKRAARFIASVSSAVATNPALQECDAGSILSSALLGEALNLSPSPQLGHFYMVPYNKKGKNGAPDTKIAQFQMGYKGYCQLAMRSGFYKRINVVEIRQGELIKFDLLNEEIQVAMEGDEEIREGLDVVGYYAMFEYLNGFRKEIFWTKKKMLSHADKYSQAFNKNIFEIIQSGRVVNIPKNQQAPEGYVAEHELWKYSSFWYKSFDDMAFKTMLRHLLSRWGIMSIEMTEAFSKDMAEIKPDGGIDYIDGTTTEMKQEKPINNEPKNLPPLSGEEFNAKKSQWHDLVVSGKKTVGDLLAMLEAKNTLTEEQVLTIDSWKLEIEA